MTWLSRSLLANTHKRCELGRHGENFILINNQNWENHIKRSGTMDSSAWGSVWDGNIAMSLSSDSTLTYRGVEIDSLLADNNERSLISAQVEMGVSVRMACLEMLKLSRDKIYK